MTSSLHAGKECDYLLRVRLGTTATTSVAASTEAKQRYQFLVVSLITSNNLTRKVCSDLVLTNEGTYREMGKLVPKKRAPPLAVPSFEADIHKLIDTFVLKVQEGATVRLQTFKELWRSSSFSFVHQAVPLNIPAWDHLQLLYSVALNRLADPSPYLDYKPEPGEPVFDENGQPVSGPKPKLPGRTRATAASQPGESTTTTIDANGTNAAASGNGNPGGTGGPAVDLDLPDYELLAQLDEMFAGVLDQHPHLYQEEPQPQPHPHPQLLDAHGHLAPHPHAPAAAPVLPHPAWQGTGSEAHGQLFAPPLPQQQGQLHLTALQPELLLHGPAAAPGDPHQRQLLPCPPPPPPPQQQEDLQPWQMGLEPDHHHRQQQQHQGADQAPPPQPPPTAQLLPPLLAGLVGQAAGGDMQGPGLGPGAGLGLGTAEEDDYDVAPAGAVEEGLTA
ncbi:hypothetical protein Agub_g3025, partial [Astrephomene gubernaculifera]